MTLKKVKRFIVSHHDEMGLYGKNVDDVSISDENGLVCYASDLENLLKTPISRILNREELEKTLEQCKLEG